MSIEFIGFVAGQESSETIAPTGPVVNRDYTRAVALAHEAGDFDRVLIAQNAR